MIYIENTIIQPRESAVKESQNITPVHCEFNGKYPFWYNNNTMISNCIFNEGARVAIWYGKNIEMKDSLVNAPKMFREIELLKVNKNLKVHKLLLMKAFFFLHMICSFLCNHDIDH